MTTTGDLRLVGTMKTTLSILLLPLPCTVLRRTISTPQRPSMHLSWRPCWNKALTTDHLPSRLHSHRGISFPTPLQYQCIPPTGIHPSIAQDLQLSHQLQALCRLQVLRFLSRKETTMRSEGLQAAALHRDMVPSDPWIHRRNSEVQIEPLFSSLFFGPRCIPLIILRNTPWPLSRPFMHHHSPTNLVNFCLAFTIFFCHDGLWNSTILF